MKPFLRIGEYVYRLVEPRDLVLYQGSVYRLAGKKEDLIAAHPELEEEITELASKKKVKYLEWGTKQLAEGHSLEDLLSVLEVFDKFSSKFKHRDIYRYDLDSLSKEAKELSEQGALVSKREKRKKSKATGAKKIYEDNDLLLIRIDSKRACIQYGKGTKWCITMEGTSYWEDYRREDTLFYYLFVGEEKYAIALYRKDNSFEFFDAQNNPLKTVPYWDKLKPLILEDAPKAPNKYFLALDLKTSPEVLRELAKEDEFKEAVAGNPSTPPDVLLELAREKDKEVLFGLAKNPSTPPEALIILSRDKDAMVRVSVAENPSTPSEALGILAKDKERAVRYWVAENPATPPEALIILSRDKYRDVRYQVANNPATSSEALLELARDKYRDVRYRVAKNPSTPPEALKELARDTNRGVRLEVARNPSAPSKILKELAKDEDRGVRDEVAKNPNTPSDAFFLFPPSMRKK